MINSGTSAPAIEQKCVLCLYLFCGVHYIVTYYINVLIQIKVYIEHHKKSLPCYTNREIYP